MMIVLTVQAAARTADSDRAAIIALENEWLKNLHNAPVLERILAPDFLHPVATGDVLTKSEHIQFASKHVPVSDSAKHFEDLQVRLYGDVAIVTGVVVSRNTSENKNSKTVFTDVFVYRRDRWQAVNAQENIVTSLRERQ
jgi:ketosteroid isomerase-like protein